MWRALVVVALFLSCAESVGREQLFAVDFGTVAVGEVHTTSLRLVNSRYVPSRLVRIEQREGARGFTIVPRYEPLPSGAETEWTVHFDAFETGLKSARFVAIFERGESEVLITARSAERCAIEPRVDFGAGPRGERTVSFPLINDTDQPGAAFLGSLAAPFTSELTGRIALAAGERRDVKLHFQGDAVGLFEQSWHVQPSPGCAATFVTLLASVQEQPLLLSPGRLHFADTVAQLQLEIRNATNAPIQLTPRVGTGFHLADDAPFTVPGGGRIAVTVLRDDFTTAPLFSELVFHTTSTQQPQLRVPLLARFKSTCVTATENVSFTSQFVGCATASQKVVVTNECPHAVRIGSPRVEWPFHVVSARLGTLAAGASTEIAATFKPLTVGNVLAPMTIPVDVLDGQQSVVVGLRGLADEIPFRDERQHAPILWPDVDVLLIIDDTPVMAAYADSIRSNLARVNSMQTGNGRHPRFAVTTTSMSPSEQGKFRITSSGAKWLQEPTTAELQALTAFTGTQTGGSSCLEAMAAADLASFRRRDASMMILCVTANPDAARGPAGLLFDHIARRVPERTFFGLVARYASAPDCPGDLDSGTLRSLSDRTNGVVEELCNPNWGASLDNTISYFGWRTNYFLEQRPDFSVAPLKVFVNSIELPQSSSPDRKWTYEAQTNSVNFEPLFVPEQGSELRFVYATECPR